MLGSFAATALLAASSAHAQVGRRRFDPEDLQLEEPGAVHMDLQLGVIRGPAAGRWVVPDFGIDIGVSPTVELGADGQLALEGSAAKPYALDHVVADNVWLSSKVGLFDHQDHATHTAWAGGFQLGPKLAVAPGARGTGFEGLILVGRTIRKTVVVVNAGGFVDPGAAISRRRPIGIEGGVDVEVGFGGRAGWSFLADLSAVYFPSGQPAQLQSTFGPQLAVASWLSVSTQAVIGVLSSTDHFGALLVLSPRFRLLH